MYMDIKIRKFKTIDMAGINSILKESLIQNADQLPNHFTVPESLDFNSEFLQKLNKSKTSIILVAESQNKVVGYLAAYPASNPVNAPFYKDRKHLLVDEITVSKRFQNLGIGSKLIAECEQLAKRKGFREIQLDVFDFNTNAKRFYSRQGFKIIKQTMVKRI